MGGGWREAKRSSGGGTNPSRPWSVSLALQGISLSRGIYQVWAAVGEVSFPARGAEVSGLESPALSQVLPSVSWLQIQANNTTPWDTTFLVPVWGSELMPGNPEGFTNCDGPGGCCRP